jgi:hypothetical protein
MGDASGFDCFFERLGKFHLTDELIEIGGPIPQGDDGVRQGKRLHKRLRERNDGWYQPRQATESGPDA